MKLDKKKITELVRGINKTLLSTVHSQIVKNIKLLLPRARPGFQSALCSLAKKAKNYLSIGQPRLGQKLPHT